MVSLYVYDILFFLVFTIGIIFFLVKNRKKKGFKREGWMFLYRTKYGVKAMDWFDKKFHKTLGWLRYVIIALGYILMVLMIWMLLQSVVQYATQPEITDTIKAPPVAPLIPYFPEIFGMESFFPPFYFTYFLIALAIVALVHEFSHGVFMKYSKTKIKSTGVLFMGPILGAFVEEDPTSLHSKKRTDQMAVLGAGVFANIITAIFFFLIYSLIFSTCFTSIGYSPDHIFSNSPADKVNLTGVILSVDNVPIDNYEQFVEVMSSYSPNDEIFVITDSGKYNITLGSDANDSTRPILGVGNYNYSRNGKFIQSLMDPKRNTEKQYTFKISDSGVLQAYQSSSGFSYFLYHLVWWVMIINLLVALFNMLPLGMLDGGRFFYLTMEKFVGPKKAEKAYKIAGKFILSIFIALVLLWLYRILF